VYGHSCVLDIVSLCLGGGVFGAIAMVRVVCQT
jgi:hypothetical protein